MQPRTSQVTAPTSCAGRNGGSGRLWGVGPRLVLRTLPGNRALLWPGCGPAAVDALWLGALSTSVVPLSASWGHGDQEAIVLLPPWTREPGVLSGSHSCHSLPSARPDPDRAVGPGWLGGDRRDKASTAQAGCGIGPCSHGPATRPRALKAHPSDARTRDRRGAGLPGLCQPAGGRGRAKGPPSGGRCILPDHTGLPATHLPRLGQSLFNLLW